MNSYLYGDDVQSEKTTEFRQHETEMEYGGEYDAVMPADVGFVYNPIKVYF